MERDKKLFIVIDGSALMCNAYYATLPYEIKCARTDAEKESLYSLIEHNKKGIYTNGIEGFLNVLFQVIQSQNPDYLAICFDKGKETTFRKQIYPEYKAQRTPKPEPLVKQMTNIKIFLKAIGVPILEAAEYEADDFAGSLCKTFQGKDIDIRFITKDRDYLQLVNNYVKGWYLVGESMKDTLISKYGIQENVPKGMFEYDSAIIKKEYGIYPYQIADWKGISGDASDNLPGIKGISDKTAIPLLQNYGSLESILVAIKNAKEKGFEKVLKTFWKEQLKITRPQMDLFLQYEEMGLLCKELAIIKTDLDVGDIDTYQLQIDYDKLFQLCHQLELYDFADKIEQQLQNEQLDMELDRE